MKFVFLALTGISYLIGAVVYLSPGVGLLWDGSTTRVLSDGTDPAAFPQYFAHLLQLFRDSPASLLFGAIHTPLLGAPEGLSQWIPLTERPLVLFLSAFMPVEQISTGYALAGMVLDALVMYALGRAMSVPRSVSWGMGAAWAFCAFTRARAKVHMGLVGIYHLPLVFLALWWASRKEKKALAAFCLLVVAAVPHYYIVMLLPFLPLLLLYAWWVRTPLEPEKVWAARLSIVSVPALGWVLWSLLMPLPPSVAQKTRAFPVTGVSAPGKSHPFMYRFAARPVDYFTGDIGLGVTDPNPLKETLNQSVVADGFDGSNPHERALGVRWSLWIIAAVALVYLSKKKTAFWPDRDRRLVILFALFGVGSFWLSLSPAFGLSSLLHALVSQFRVPNRAGIGVAFALIMISGLFLKALALQRPKWGRYLGAGFVVLVLLEFPPYLHALPTTEILPAHQSLQAVPCGTGIRFPYVSGQFETLHYYYFLQRMRGSLCPSINAPAPSAFDLIARRELARTDQVPRLKQLIDCMPLKWVVFGPPLPVEEARKTCAEWGWTWHEGGACLSESLTPTATRHPVECMKP